jgi:hypothetical protein
MSKCPVTIENGPKHEKYVHRKCIHEIYVKEDLARLIAKIRFPTWGAVFFFGLGLILYSAIDD